MGTHLICDVEGCETKETHTSMRGIMAFPIGWIRLVKTVKPDDLEKKKFLKNRIRRQPLKRRIALICPEHEKEFPILRNAMQDEPEEVGYMIGDDDIDLMG